MSVHRYRPGPISGDYARTLFGLSITGLPLLLVDDVATLAYVILIPLVTVFMLFGARTVIRHGTTIALDDGGISTAGMTRVSLPWRDLEDLSLRYFSTRSDKSTGWMQLSLKANGRTLKMDSALDGFETVVAAAAAAAWDNRLGLSFTTVNNLESLGVSMSAEEDGPEAQP